MIKAINQYLPYNALKSIFDALAIKGESRLVGGCVRELLTNNTPKDIDVASQVTPGDVIQLLSKAGFKCIPTGIKYGTVTALFEDLKIEITTLRSDIKTDGRHAEVIFTDKWQEDAKRRDFTVNAMYMDLSGNIYDYYDGIQDLKNHTIKFVGDPYERINEDYLRILRYFRFCGYFNELNIDQPSFEACVKLKEKINLLSGERIRDELFKILTLKHAKRSLNLMLDTSVLDVLFDHDISHTIKDLHLSDSAIANFISILIASAYPERRLNELTNKFKLSNTQKNLVIQILKEARNHILDSEFAHLKMLYLLGREVYSTYLQCAKTLGITIYTAPNNLITPALPIRGSDIKKMSFEGKEIGDKMKHLEAVWIESGFTLTKEELLKLL